ncbi:FtsB family cell division protein [Bombilactobacillus bombi]|uniref:FtsB family cell division protein n=1 Tax=Bombilactobacillus bombi TaxID=1303590 RepID=UPI0015E61FFF|nr:septum formation initiator family protein [Bombilactobacillus bombi]
MPQVQRLNNVRSININNNDLSAEKKFKQRVRQVHQRRLSALFLVLGGVAALLGSQLYQAHQINAQTRTQLVQQHHKLRQARAQRTDLRNQIHQLHDPEYLDNLIRYRFNYSHDGEIIYNIPNESNKNLNF